MKKPDKKALKSAGLITVIALVVFEAVALLVQLVDPEGGLLRVDLRNPVHHGILAAAALLLGVSAFLRERRKKESSYANNFEITDDQQFQLFTLYGLERTIFRLSVSPYNGPRQEYCDEEDNPECRLARKRKNRQDCDARKRQAKQNG